MTDPVSAKTVTVEQLATALGTELTYARFMGLDDDALANAIFAALPDPEAFLDRTRTTISDALSEAGVEGTVDVGLAVTDQVYLGQAVEDVLAAAVALRVASDAQVPAAASAFTKAVDRYRASTPEPKPPSPHFWEVINETVNAPEPPVEGEPR